MMRVLLSGVPEACDLCVWLCLRYASAVSEARFTFGGVAILGGCLTVVVGSVTVFVVAPPVSVAIEQRRCHGLTGCQSVVRFPTVSRLRFRVGVRSVRLALVPRFHYE